jgi:hypothetical protein
MAERPPTTISNLQASPPIDQATARRMAVTLYAALIPMVAAGFIVQASVGAPPTASISTMLTQAASGDLVEIRDSNGAAVLSGEFRTRVDSLGNTEKDAELTNQKGAVVIGEVELEIPAPGREHRRPELEVDIIHLQPRQRYTVVIDDRAVGTFVTDDRGSVDMELQEGETLPGQIR